MELPFGLTDVIAQGFRGRRIDLQVSGRRLTGLLAGIDLRPGRTLSATLALSDVCFDGMPVTGVSLRAAEVAIEMPPRVGFLLSGLELAGAVAIDDLVAWADRGSPGWSLERAGEEAIRAIERDGPRRVIAVPEKFGSTVTLQIKRVGWRDVWVDVPRWMPLTHTVPLPALPAGVSVVEATRQGESVAFRLAIRDVGRKIDLLAVLTGG